MTSPWNLDSEFALHKVILRSIDSLSYSKKFRAKRIREARFIQSLAQLCFPGVLVSLENLGDFYVGPGANRVSSFGSDNSATK